MTNAPLFEGQAPRPNFAGNFKTYAPTITLQVHVHVNNVLHPRQLLNALRMQMVDNGWNSVPSSPSDKKCYVEDWPTIETNEFHIERGWSFPAHTNTALVCNREYFAVDIDVASDPALAHRIQTLAFEHLGITPFIRIGRAPKCLLIYRQTKPGAVCSQSVKAASGNGDGVEILSARKQFTAFGIHNETGKPYRWVGESNPLNDMPSSAPLTDQEHVGAFLRAVAEVMPFGSSGSGADAARHTTAEGLIDDGRENLLRDCIWQAAHEINAAGNPLTAAAVAALGWDRFTSRAWLEDGKYRERHARTKAQSLIRLINSGRVKLDASAHAVPTYALVEPEAVEAARHKLGQILAEFIAPILDSIEARQRNDEPEPDATAVIDFNSAADDDIPFHVHAMRVATGVGKTRASAQAIAADRHARRQAGEQNDRPRMRGFTPCLRIGWGGHCPALRYSWPESKSFAGREASNPEDPLQKMCMNLEQVKLAVETGLPVTTACCKHKPKRGKERRCQFIDTCGYQRQLRGENPDVWIGAHELLFHPQQALRNIVAVVVDESFWQDGLRIAKQGVALKRDGKCASSLAS